jgi:hypothetical protein
MIIVRTVDYLGMLFQVLGPGMPPRTQPSSNLRQLSNKRRCVSENYNIDDHIDEETECGHDQQKQQDNPNDLTRRLHTVAATIIASLLELICGLHERSREQYMIEVVCDSAQLIYLIRQQRSYEM